MNWFSEAWHFLFGWPGVDIIVGCGAVAVAVLEPPIVAAIIPDLRKWAICVAVLAFSLTAISGKFYNDGLAVKQAEWDQALAREAVDGEADRAAAVAAIGPVSSDRSLFRSDPFNRDRGTVPSQPKSPVRWFTSHNLFGKW